MGSYSRSSQHITNMPKTLGAQDQGILAEGGSVVNVLDEKAIENAFSFADKVYEQASDNTAKTLNLAEIYNEQDAENLQKIIDLGKMTYLRSADIAEEALKTQAETVDNAMRFMSQADIEKREGIENTQNMYEQLLPQKTEQKQNMLFYSTIVAGLMMLYFMKKNA